MKTAIFITARTKSTRLPKKVLLNIHGKKVIEHLIDRVKLAQLPDHIVLCTSRHPNDNVLIQIAKQNNIEYFLGSEDDVLERFLQAAEKFNIDFIITTWGDELFCDPEYIDKAIELFKKTNADFISCNELPLGTFTYGVKVRALKKVCEIKEETDTEIWGDYFIKNKSFRIHTLRVDDDNLKKPEIRMTMDYPEDYLFVKKIFDMLYEKGKIFSLREILALLKKHQEFLEINKDCQKLYEKNLARLNKVKISAKNV